MCGAFVVRMLVGPSQGLGGAASHSDQGAEERAAGRPERLTPLEPQHPSPCDKPVEASLRPDWRIFDVSMTSWYFQDTFETFPTLT